METKNLFVTKQQHSLSFQLGKTAYTFCSDFFFNPRENEKTYNCDANVHPEPKLQKVWVNLEA